jgi:hypothetical protein
MSRKISKLNKQWNALLCRLMGHDLVKGYKFKSVRGVLRCVVVVFFTKTPLLILSLSLRLLI